MIKVYCKIRVPFHIVRGHSNNTWHFRGGGMAKFHINFFAVLNSDFNALGSKKSYLRDHHLSLPTFMTCGSKQHGIVTKIVSRNLLCLHLNNRVIRRFGYESCHIQTFIFNITDDNLRNTCNWKSLTMHDDLTNLKGMFKRIFMPMNTKYWQNLNPRPSNCESAFDLFTIHFSSDASTCQFLGVKVSSAASSSQKNYRRPIFAYSLILICIKKLAVLNISTSIKALVVYSNIFTRFS